MSPVSFTCQQQTLSLCNVASLLYPQYINITINERHENAKKDFENGSLQSSCHVGSWHHGMTRPRVAVGGNGLQIWRVAANVLNK